MSAIEERIAAEGIKLPDSPVAGGNFAFFVRTGNLVFISGQVPRDEEGKFITGTLGADLELEQGYEAAKRCAVYLLRQILDSAGSFANVKKIVKLEGFVKSTDEFADHPKVINGASDLLVKIFGKEVGTHARFAVGTPSLPRGVPVEIAAIIELVE
eukprot:Rhum_TRINITY_DN25408_c0_g1::Rhum_TRINITY_DN25408_c0_g1_i1::g.182044::m.182044